MDTHKKNQTLLLVSCVLVAAIIFFLDLKLPLGVAGGVPYVSLVLLSLWLRHPRYTIIAAIIGSVLTILGFFFSPAAGTIWVVLVNRFLALFAIWVTAILSLQRKRQEAKQAQLKLAYEQAQKMEAIGQLAGGIAHDFNNLLQGINGFAELALSDMDEHHPSRSSIEEVSGGGKRAADLVRQLLAFSRRQVLEMEDVDLNKIISNLINMIQRVIGKHINLTFLPAVDLGTVRQTPGPNLGGLYL